MPSRVFVSYVQDNIATVKRLVSSLRDRGVEVWFDQDALPPGVYWRDEIRQAVRHHEFFLACFSNEYAARQRTYMNEELELAITEIRMRGSNPWFIPVLLSGEIPDREVGAGRTLRDIQFVRLADEHWEKAVDAIARVVLPPSLAAALAGTGDRPITLSGLTSQTIENVTLQAGLWRLKFSHVGLGAFAITLASSTQTALSLASGHGALEGSRLFTVPQSSKLLCEVTATSFWQVTILRPRADGSVRGLVGGGYFGSDLRRLERGVHHFQLEHGGEGPFAVTLFDRQGRHIALLASTSGSGEKIRKTMTLDGGEYGFDIVASGWWFISW